MREGMPPASVRPPHGGYPSPPQWSMSFSYWTGLPRIGGDQDMIGGHNIQQSSCSSLVAKRPLAATSNFLEDVLGSLAPLGKRLRLSAICPALDEVAISRKRTSLDAFGFGGQQAAIARGPMFRRHAHD
mmetsp:Transcript_6319/g.13827  ORF Transcript_6319/g.13827 Transcript_6319/m.13827 type:complete len:129 (-) Transcript_6319:68-454(-)